jgi:hypothetical protein
MIFSVYLSSNSTCRNYLSISLRALRLLLNMRFLLLKPYDAITRATSASGLKLSTFMPASQETILLFNLTLRLDKLITLLHTALLLKRRGLEGGLYSARQNANSSLNRCIHQLRIAVRYRKTYLVF